MNILPEPDLKPETLSPVDILLSDDYFRGEIDIPPRGQLRRRPLPEFDD
jgi:hypothetical protein